MSKLADKFLSLLRVDYDEDYDDDYDDFDGEDNVGQTFKKNSRKEPPAKERELKYTPASDAERFTSDKNTGKASKQSKVVPMSRSGHAHPEVHVYKPTLFDEGREIADLLLSGRAVILNLEGLHQEIGQKIIDFLAGACYSINGNLQKISSYIFLATPESIDISGDLPEIMGGFDLASFK